jgi:nitroreductase
LDFKDVVRTTFAARQFTEEPVPDAVLHEILDEARFAPSGGNRQPWRVVVVKSEAKRARLAELIVPTMRRYLAERSAGENPCNTIVPSAVTDAQVAETPDPTPMARLLVGAPALLMVFVDLRVVASFDRDLPRVGVISGASVYPFVWNVLLAARNRGYGGTITTFAAGAEPAVQELFDVPSHMAVAAMLPIGRPVKQLTKLRRKPVEEFATIDGVEGERLRAPA